MLAKVCTFKVRDHPYITSRGGSGGVVSHLRDSAWKNVTSHKAISKTLFSFSAILRLYSFLRDVIYGWPLSHLIYTPNKSTKLCTRNSYQRRERTNGKSVRPPPVQSYPSSAGPAPIPVPITIQTDSEQRTIRKGIAVVYGTIRPSRRIASSLWGIIF